VADRIQACLPGSARTREQDYPTTYEIVRHGRFEARVVEHGSDRGKVGRSIYIYVAALAAPARAGPVR